MINIIDCNGVKIWMRVIVEFFLFYLFYKGLKRNVGFWGYILYYMLSILVRESLLNLFCCWFFDF